MPDRAMAARAVAASRRRFICAVLLFRVFSFVGTVEWDERPCPETLMQFVI
jgi:hypothetical protein